MDLLAYSTMQSQHFHCRRKDRRLANIILQDKIAALLMVDRFGTDW